MLFRSNVVQREVALGKERVSIGRKPHNDVRIDSLAVSGEHALIVTLLNDSFLEDLGSTNGTLVNGHPVRKHILRDGDIIEIGKYKLKYVSEAPPAQSSVADFERSMGLKSGALSVSPDAPPAARFGDTQVNPLAAVIAEHANDPIAEGAPRVDRLAALQILSGPAAGREVKLAKALTTVGRQGVQVAVIARRPHGYFVTHVEGDNLPVLNGRQLDEQAHALRDHDVLELAGVKMEFFFKN